MTASNSKTGEIVVIGGGSWGGALADQLQKAKNSVRKNHIANESKWKKAHSRI